jgi:hypothetical protein
MRAMLAMLAAMRDVLIQAASGAGSGRVGLAWLEVALDSRQAVRETAHRTLERYDFRRNA